MIRYQSSLSQPLLCVSGHLSGLEVKSRTRRGSFRVHGFTWVGNNLGERKKGATCVKDGNQSEIPEDMQVGGGR